MTNHWDIELEIIKLGKKCYVDVTGDPWDGERSMTVQEALTCINTALKLGLEAVQERNELRAQANKPDMTEIVFVAREGIKGKLTRCRSRARTRLNKGLATLSSLKDYRLRLVRKPRVLTDQEVRDGNW